MIIAPVASARKSRSRSIHVPAPMKGMNTASPMTETPDVYGLRFENLVGRSDGYHTRQGFEYVAVGLDGPVTTLMAYPSHVVAATSASGAPWQWTTISNPGGVFLLAVNGSDYLRMYNGTVWTTLQTEYSNIDTRTVASICTHQSRVWLGSSTDLTLYYLPFDALMGPVSSIPLTPVCRKGGAIAAIASMTQDGGRGQSDQLLVITTNGEAVLFSGGDPDTSQTWSLVGVWDVPKPIGRRCLVKTGGTIAYLCTRGLIPIPQVLSKQSADTQQEAISEAIWPTFCADIATGSWEMEESAEHEVLIVHGPQGQYIKSGTGAWTTWQMPLATTWLNHRGELYFGTSDGSICRYAGTLDGAVPINASIIHRYDRYGTPGLKTTSALRLQYKAAKPYTPRVRFLRNFADLPATDPVAHYTDGVNYYWEDVTWPRQPTQWVRPITMRQSPWRSISAEGMALALTIGMRTTVPIIYTGYDLQYELGAAL